MATKNPRINFVPTDVVLALVSRISELTGQSRASICSEMLDNVAPVMAQQLDALEKLRDMPERAREHLEELAAAAHRDIDQAMLELPPVDRRRKHHRERVRRAAGT